MKREVLEMTTLEKLSFILDQESIEKIEKCSRYFDIDVKSVVKLAIDELWLQREEVYKQRQPIVHKIACNQYKLWSE